MLIPGGVDCRFDPEFVWKGMRHLPALWREERLLSAPGLGRPEVLALQARRLERILEHAYRTVPFYRERLGPLAKAYPGFKGCPLAAVPPLRKRDILGREESLLSSEPRPNVRHHTSGTSGEPLAVLMDLYLRYHSHLLLKHHLAGPPGRGLRVRPFQTKIVYLRTLRPGQRAQALNTFTFLPALDFARHLTLGVREEPGLLRSVAAFMRESRPEILSGEPTDLHLYVTWLKSLGHLEHPSRPRAVLTSGSQLLPAQRLEFEAFFGAAVIEHYGLAEIGMVGLQTPGREGYVCPDLSFIIEILDQDLKPVSPGEDGLIALTSLESRTMPFIRYVPGDMGRLSAEMEGPFPRLEALSGRVYCLFTRKDGSLLHPFALMKLLTRHRLKRFQVIQESLGLLRVLSGEPLDAPLREALTAAIRGLMGDERLAIAFEQSSFDQPGKFQAFLSKVPNPYNDAVSRRRSEAVTVS